jgi:HD-like signal output (HDOD) protein
MDPSSAYTAGLLHDVGRLALVGLDPPRYQALVEQALRNERPLPELERDAFGTDSEQARAALMARWGLPGQLAGSGCCQSGPVQTPQGPLPEAVHRACTLDCQAGFAMVPLPAAAESDQELASSVVIRLNLFECEFMQPA